MATKKAALTARNSAAKRPVAKKQSTTKVTTVKAVEPAHVSRPTSVSTHRTRRGFNLDTKLPGNLFGIIVAELVGTFILTMVALSPSTLTSTVGLAPIFVGFAMFVIAAAVFNVSGAHVNPAVSFGMWSVGKLKTVLVPFYWISQFLGAILAVLVLDWIGKGFSGLNFSHFWNLNWQIFGVEMVGTAVFVFAFAAIMSRLTLSNTGKALGIGLALGVGLLVSNTALTNVQNNIDKTAISSIKDVPQTLRVSSAVVNPAVSIAVNEKTDAELQGGAASGVTYSRFGITVILATLIGAAVGANVLRLVNYGKVVED